MSHLTEMRLVSRVTEFAKRELDEYEIRGLVSLASECTFTNHSLVDELMRALLDERKIDAIKCYRALVGVGLVEAKNAVEQAYNMRKPR